MYLSRAGASVTSVVVLVLCRLLRVAAFPPDIFDPHYESLYEGDINLGAIVSVHTSEKGRCVARTAMGLGSIEYMEAILFAVRQVNKEQVIPGITLGIYILDDCFSTSLSLMRALQFMPNPSPHTHSHQHPISSHYFHPSQDDTYPAHNVTKRSYQVQTPSGRKPSVLYGSDKKRVLSRGDETKDSQRNLTVKKRQYTIYGVQFPLKNDSIPVGHSAQTMVPLVTIPTLDRRALQSSSRRPTGSENTHHFEKRSAKQLFQFQNTYHHNQNETVNLESHMENTSSSSTMVVSGNVSTPFNVDSVRGANKASPSQNKSSEKKPFSSAEADSFRRGDNSRRRLPRFFDVAGVIGALTSQHTIEVAKVLQLFQLPQISPSATSDVLSDKIRFPYFLRTMPPDRDQVKAIGQLVRYFNWTYVSVVYSEEPYGHGSQVRLADTLRSLQVCVAATLALSAAMTPSHYDGIIRGLRRHQQARVVLLYADVKHIRPLMEAVERNGAAPEFIWVGSDSLFTELQQSPRICDRNLGSIVFKAHVVTPPAFLEHMMAKIYRHQGPPPKPDNSLESWSLPADLFTLTSRYSGSTITTQKKSPSHSTTSSLSSSATPKLDLDQSTTTPAVTDERSTTTANPSFHRHEIHPKPTINLFPHTTVSEEDSLHAFAVPFASNDYQPLHSFGMAGFVIDSVYAYAHALKALLRENCPEARGHQARECVRSHRLHPYLKRVQFNGTSGRFEFDENGDVVGAIDVGQCQRKPGDEVNGMTIIGRWEHRHGTLNIDHARFFLPGQDSHAVPRSVCAQPCREGEIYSFSRQTCCWTCVACKTNEITTANASGCLPCPPLQWPNQQTRLKCRDITIPPTPTHPVLSLVLHIAAVVGLMMTLVTAFTFCLYRGQRVIRSSSRELSGMMLGGLTASYLLVFPVLAQPSAASCLVIHLGFGLTFTLIYAPLLVKTHRIFRIFRAGTQSAALPRCTSSASQLGIALALISAQVVIVIVSTTIDSPSAVVLQPVQTQPMVVRLCHLPVSGLATSLAYHVLLVLVCTLLAFKTRRLPDNYNESRYIAFCVDTSLLVWIIFVPAYFTATVGSHKVVVLALTHLINSYVQLACLFLPRLYALYRQTKQPTAPGDGASKLGSYGLISVRGGGSAVGSRCGDSNGGVDSGGRGGGECGDKMVGFTPGSNGMVSVSDVMGSNTISIGGSSVVVWENRDEEQILDTAAV